ncbi:MAG: hypothetical protein JO372_19730 [Solirubrobacterales bacterium]|nr:hypothetical protein [Solirubrobacterales bacterium]
MTRGVVALEAVPPPVLPELADEPPLLPVALPPLAELAAGGLDGLGGVEFAAEEAGGGVAVDAWGAGGLAVGVVGVFVVDAAVVCGVDATVVCEVGVGVAGGEVWFEEAAEGVGLAAVVVVVAD